MSRGFIEIEEGMVCLQEDVNEFCEHAPLLFFPLGHLDGGPRFRRTIGIGHG